MSTSKRLSVVVEHEELNRVGNWAGARDLFPRLVVDQARSRVTVTYYSVANGDDGQWGVTHEHAEKLSADGQVCVILGITGLRNDRHHTGGRQKFIFAVFRGDSGHIYVHRAVASKGWLECRPEDMLDRLRRLGIGTDRDLIQQGDFLLRPANGQTYPDADFVHESMGAGHHTFAAPVLYADGEAGRQYRMTEPMLLRHHAVDGIQHPDVTVPAGTWIVGTTSPSLAHSNRRD